MTALVLVDDDYVPPAREPTEAETGKCADCGDPLDVSFARYAAEQLERHGFAQDLVTEAETNVRCLRCNDKLRARNHRHRALTEAARDREQQRFRARVERLQDAMRGGDAAAAKEILDSIPPDERKAHADELARILRGDWLALERRGRKGRR